MQRGIDVIKEIHDQVNDWNGENIGFHKQTVADLNSFGP